MGSRPDFLVSADCEMAKCLARRLSPEHRREIRELGGLDPLEAVVTSLAGSMESYACIPRGAEKPVFIFGVEPAGVITCGAMVWMLAAPDIVRYKAVVLRAARWGMGRAFEITGAEFLEQYIPGWYETGLRFVGRLGFSSVSYPYSISPGSAPHCLASHNPASYSLVSHSPASHSPASDLPLVSGFEHYRLVRVTITRKDFEQLKQKDKKWEQSHRPYSVRLR